MTDLKKGYLLSDGKYRKEKELGRGAFGIWYLDKKNKKLYLIHLFHLYSYSSNTYSVLSICFK
jgi:hypothetical protein